MESALALLLKYAMDVFIVNLRFLLAQLHIYILIDLPTRGD